MRCVTCELEIVGRAEYYAGLAFCCAGCVVGGPCSCSYDPAEDVSLPELGPAGPELVLAGMSRD